MFQAKSLFLSAGSTVSGNVSDPSVVTHVLESCCEVPGAAALFSKVVSGILKSDWSLHIVISVHLMEEHLNGKRGRGGRKT